MVFCRVNDNNSWGAAGPQAGMAAVGVAAGPRGHRGNQTDFPVSQTQVFCNIHAPMKQRLKEATLERTVRAAQTARGQTLRALPAGPGPPRLPLRGNVGRTHRRQGRTGLAERLLGLLRFLPDLGRGPDRFG